MMRVAGLTTALVLALSSSLASAEIEKHAQACETGICFYWWPTLTKVEGWSQDIGASYHYSSNALAPDGSTFNDALAVMYATATYKPRAPESASKDDLIKNDQANFISEDPDMKIAEVPSERTADGQVVRIFSFFPRKAGGAMGDGWLR